MIAMVAHRVLWLMRAFGHHLRANGAPGFPQNQRLYNLALRDSCGFLIVSVVVEALRGPTQTTCSSRFSLSGLAAKRRPIATYVLITTRLA
jgi:hypothetical protein